MGKKEIEYMWFEKPNDSINLTPETRKLIESSIASSLEEKLAVSIQSQIIQEQNRPEGSRSSPLSHYFYLFIGEMNRQSGKEYEYRFHPGERPPLPAMIKRPISSR